MARLHVAVLPGDGIGPEVIDAALRILHTVARNGAHELVLAEHAIGWAATERHGDPLPADTLEACLAADAVLLGAIGDPAAEGAPPLQRPEAGLLRLRRELGCFANLRPARVPDALLEFSALKERVARGTDIMIVRELGGGIYYGEPRGADEEHAWNTMTYSRAEVERVARLAFELAAGRRGRLTSVDKANVLEVSRMWRQVVTEIAGDFPNVRLDHMYVDRAAMELVLEPSEFDVIVTGNLFGDILSDQCGGLGGSLGLLGSASLGGRTDLYEPVHGSAPDIAGQGIANPIGAIDSVAMMLRHTFGLHHDAASVEAAVDEALRNGHRTADLRTEGGSALTTTEFTDVVERSLAGVVAPGIPEAG